MFKIITVFFLAALAGGCASFDDSPPKDVFEAWRKNDTSAAAIKNDMQACGYKNTAHANDLNETEARAAEKCMLGKGYSLDMSSYRPNNCYGPNSPYLCNRLWGGKKSPSTPVSR